MIRRISVRRGPAADWSTINPILSQGEFGFSIDDQQLKIGNGSSPWNALRSLVHSDRSITIQGASSNQVLVAGGSQTLADNRTWSLSLPQDIHSGATPSFQSLFLTSPSLLQQWQYPTDPSNIYLRLNTENPVGGRVIWNWSMRDPNDGTQNDFLTFKGGNVGIREKNPVSSLDVKSSAIPGGTDRPTFRAYGYVSNSFFEVNNNSSNSANLRLTRSDATTVFSVDGHTGNGFLIGNLGIGVNPAFKLHVSGAISLHSSSNYILWGTNASANPYIQGDSSNNLYFGAGGSYRMMYSAVGNFGVGPSVNPDERFTIRDGNLKLYSLQNVSDQYRYIGTEFDLGNGNNRAEIRFAIDGADTRTRLSFHVASGSGSLFEGMRLTHLRNLLLGATTEVASGFGSNYKLVVDATNQYNTALFRSSSHAMIQVESTSAANQSLIRFFSPTRGWSMGLNTDGSFVLGDETAGATRASVTTGGNFLIGTTSDTIISETFRGVVSSQNSGSFRVMLFNGAGASSVWWAGNNVPQFAIDSITGGGGSFWTHSSSVWMKRFDILPTRVDVISPSASYGLFRILNNNSTGETSISIGRTNQNDEQRWTFGQGTAATGDSFGFYHNGSNWLIIATTGLVGFSTNAPTETVDINGNIRVRQLSTAAGDFVTADSNGVFSRRTAAQVRSDLSLNTNYIQNQNSSAQTSNYWISGVGQIGQRLIINSIDNTVDSLQVTGSTSLNGVAIFYNAGTVGNYNENIRLPEASNGYAAIHMGGAFARSGTGANQWTILKTEALLGHRFAIWHNGSQHLGILTNGTWLYNSPPAGSSETAAIFRNAGTGALVTRTLGTMAFETASNYVPVSRLIDTQHSLAGGGSLNSNRTLSLVNDVSAPGASMFYGTNNSGVRGWYSSSVAVSDMYAHWTLDTANATGDFSTPVITSSNYGFYGNTGWNDLTFDVSVQNTGTRFNGLSLTVQPGEAWVITVAVEVFYASFETTFNPQIDVTPLYGMSVDLALFEGSDPIAKQSSDSSYSRFNGYSTKSERTLYNNVEVTFEYVNRTGSAQAITAKVRAYIEDVYGINPAPEATRFSAKRIR